MGSVEKELKERVASLQKQNEELRVALNDRLSSPKKISLEKSVSSQAISRFATLIFFLGCLSLTAIILESWEATLAARVELTFFVPLMIGHGGNTGGSVVGSTVAKLASGQSLSYSRTLLREMSCALLVGAALASATFFFLPFIKISAHTSLIVTCAIASITMLATFIGTSLPFLFSFFRLDAASLGPPAVTTIVDAIGLITYLVIADIILEASPSILAK
uniref:SLC41A/MgtE integral membrane domain-containing protein n=1 Tax=Aureoumbra lagunensis TaxID=44058 RepID=A0A7S3JQ26_9STRA|mmetsp:Transcript_11770/g.17603  ORF Transcript_11770/g.17603 Transcript_11770/m.17603 type:complete len:220 (+) Transcript_11770:69-728(+)